MAKHMTNDERAEIDATKALRVEQRKEYRERYEAKAKQVYARTAHVQEVISKGFWSRENVRHGLSYLEGLTIVEQA